jgi:serine/threonine protein kinase/Flp pilus assembly protein TadD
MNEALLSHTVATSVTQRGPGPDSFIEAFEEAWQSQGPVPLEEFLPPGDHPHFLEILTELIRVDLDYGWKRGQAVSLTEYRHRFPEAFENDDSLRGIAYEEYRLRRLAGEPVSPGEYHDHFGIDTHDWELIAAAETAKPADELTISTDPDHAPFLAELRREQPEVLRQWAQAIGNMPACGTRLHGFQLVRELGKGAFGRVFLARQGDLANRLVVVKVATDLYHESQTLAQLQHGHIVPIISVHQSGSALQAVCMPFFGTTTVGYVIQGLRHKPALPSTGRALRDLLRPSVEQPPGQQDETGWKEIESQSYVEAVLRLARGLADGLAHAHAQGILHCDLKPENVLLANDGRAMLLDFNLARDTKLRLHRVAAGVGGTLPYMAPEHLEALLHKSSKVDPRYDLYGLGVILFELLTGHPPFPRPTGKPSELIAQMITDRRGPLPSPRLINPAITPAVDAMVRRCLAAVPDQRYQSAAELREDLDRQLTHRPLRYAPDLSWRERLAKWSRRHPRLSSTTTVTVLASLVLMALVVALGIGRERLRGLEAQQLFQEHRRAFEDVRVRLDDRHLPPAQYAQVMELCREALARYGLTLEGAKPDWEQAVAVRYLPADQRDQLRDDIGELYYLLAKAGALQAEQTTDASQRATYMERALSWNQLADAYGGVRLPRALREQHADLLKLSQQGDAERQRRVEAERTPAASARDYYLLGHWNIKKGQYLESLPGLRAATRLTPSAFSPWFSLGNVHLELGQPELAVACFTACVSLRPDSAPAWFNRGIAYSKLRFWDLAVSDFDEALRRQPGFAEAYIQRAEIHMATDQWSDAEADLTAALECGKHPTRVYFLRSYVRGQLKNKAGADEDRTEGLKRDPNDELSWIARSEIRAETDPVAALTDVEQALKINPVSMLGLQQKAHLLDERLRRSEEALKVLDRAVELYPDHVPTRAGRGVNLARRGRRVEALRDAEEALRRDVKPPNLYQVACIYALTSRQERTDRLKSYELLWGALRAGFGLDLIDTDSDFDPIRKEGEFVRIVDDAKKLHQRRTSR